MIAPGMYVKTRQPASSDYICWRRFDPESKVPLSDHNVFMQFGLVVAVMPTTSIYASKCEVNVVVLLSRNSELGYSLADRWEEL